MRSQTGGLVPDFELRCSGAPLPLEGRADIASIQVDLCADALSSFELELHNWDPETQRVTWSDRSIFTIGTEIDLRLGYVDDLKPVINAEVTSTEVIFTDDEPPMLRVRGYDRLHRMTLGRRTRTFRSMSETDIARQIAREHGMTLAGPKTATARLDHVWQANQTDLEFLRHRAARLGYRMFAEGTSMYFGLPKADGRAALTLDVQQDLSAFSARTNLLGQVGSVVVQAWDDARVEAVSGSANQPLDVRSRGRTGGATARSLYRSDARDVVAGIPVATKAEADQIARGRYGAAAMTFVQGEGEGAGTAQLRPDSVIEIIGAGTGFSGTYYVRTVHHSIQSQDGFQTSFTVQRSSA